MGCLARDLKGVCEDDPIIAKAVEVCLALDQHQVRTAADLPSAVEALRREPADIILTDPFTDTFSPDAVRELAVLTRVAPATPIVVTTAHAQAARVDPAQYGLAAVLLKPFAPHDLRRFVQRELAGQPPGPGSRPVRPPVRSGADGSTG
jgi:DNA-binding NtrC family response regulator